MSQNTVTLGRVSLDAAGIRRGKLLGFIGSSFDLRWADITGWAVGTDVMTSRAEPEGVVLAWVLELDHAEGTVVIRWGRGENAFQAFVEAIAQHIPACRRETRVGKLHDARLPPSLRWMQGPDHKGGR